VHGAVGSVTASPDVVGEENSDGILSVKRTSVERATRRAAQARLPGTKLAERVRVGPRIVRINVMGHTPICASATRQLRDGDDTVFP
jgi:hypothetical protein